MGRQEMELDKARVEREAKMLQIEVADLQKRLDQEQRQALQLQAEVRREQKAVMKLGQIGLLEDENRRLTAEVKSLEERLAEIHKQMDVQKLTIEPLERNAR